MKILKNKLIAGFGVNAFGQAVTIVTQLASLPVLLSIWTPDQYGLWLIMTTIPIYVLMCDFGFIAVSMNKICIQAGQDRHQEALELSGAQLFFTSVVCLVVLSFSVAIIYSPIAIFFKFVEFRQPILFLVLAALLHVYSGVFDTLFRFNNKYVLGTFLLELARLLEWLCMICGALLTRNYTGAAAGWLVGRATSVLFILIFIKTKIKSRLIKVPSKNAWSVFLGLKKESYGWMAMRLGDSINLQGMTILIGTVLGPVVVAHFNAYRTISRCILQITSAIAHSFWPEFSKLAGHDEKTGLLTLFANSKKLTLVVSFSTGVAIFLFSENILLYWSHGKLDYYPVIMAIMILSGIVAGYWYIIRIFMVATNNLFGMANFYIGSSLMLILLSAVFGPSVSLLLVVSLVLINEIVLAIYSQHKVSKIYEK